MFLSSRRRLCVFAVAAASVISTTNAASLFSDVAFFGDSLSDTGNVLSLTTLVAPPPFPTFPGAEGRFSNGRVWTEYVAAGLGMPSKSSPSNLLFTGAAVIPIGPQGGQNFAYGGARTGLGGSAGSTTGLLGQLINWNGSVPPGSALTRPADGNALYVIVAGANDLRDFRSGVSGALDPLQIAVNIGSAVAALGQAGARHFLVSNLPDLGKTPEAVALGLVPQSTAATLAFNASIGPTMSAVDAAFMGMGIDLDIRTMDFYGLVEDIYDDAINNSGAVYGITNVTAPCIEPGQLSGQYFFFDATDSNNNCSISAYSDPLHPSAATHRLIGQLALDSLATVPEPGSLLLVALAVLLLAMSRPRLAAKAK